MDQQVGHQQCTIYIHTYIHTYMHACIHLEQEDDQEAWINKWDINDVRDVSAQYYRECVLSGMAKVRV